MHGGMHFEGLLKVFQMPFECHLKAVQRPFEGLPTAFQRPFKAVSKAFWRTLKGILLIPQVTDTIDASYVFNTINVTTASLLL